MPDGYSRDQFVIDLRHCGLNQTSFAQRLQITAGTVHHWGSARTPFPAWVPELLSAWRRVNALQTLLDNRTSSTGTAS